MSIPSGFGGYYGGQPMLLMATPEEVRKERRNLQLKNSAENAAIFGSALGVLGAGSAAWNKQGWKAVGSAGLRGVGAGIAISLVFDAVRWGWGKVFD